MSRRMSPYSHALKRKRSFDNALFIPGRQLKRSKSENVSLPNRCTIAIGSVIFAKTDNRERDANGKLVPLSIQVKKAYAPSSDMAQKDLVTTYFNDIDRTVVSQSKSRTHLFAAPNWGAMEVYLFPWIRANNANPHIALTRLQIKHVAFRIYEYLIRKGRVTIRHEEGSGQENVAIGECRGWWWEADGDLPRGYDTYDGKIPADYREVLLKAMAKPWPARVNPAGLIVDAATPAPAIGENVADTPPPSPIPQPAKPSRTLSDFAPQGASTFLRRDNEFTFTRPTLQRSATIAHPQPRRIPVGDLLNQYKTSSRSDALFKEDFYSPMPAAMPIPADVGGYFGVPSTTSSVFPGWHHSVDWTPTESTSLSPPDIFTPSWDFFQPRQSSWDLTTPFTNTTTTSPVEAVVVGSNLNSSHLNDVWWMGADSLPKPTIAAEPIEDKALRTLSYAEEVIFNTQVSQLSQVDYSALDLAIAASAGPLESFTEDPSTSEISPSIQEVLPPVINASPTGSTSSSTSFDHQLLQLRGSYQGPLPAAHEFENSQVDLGQYFPYDPTAVAVPNQQEFEFNDYTFPPFNVDGFELQGWNGVTEEQRNGVFDDLLFH